MLARRHPGRGLRQGRVRDPARRRPGRAGARSAGPLSEGTADRRRPRLRAAGRPGGGIRRGAGAGAGSAARCARHRVPAARLAGPAADPGRRDGELCRDRAAHRPAEGGARGRAGLRLEPARGRDPMPPRGEERWRALRLSLGRGAQARPAGEGARSMSVQTMTRPSARAAGPAADRVQALDWHRITDDLAAQGSAMLEKLLAPEECRAIAALYPEDGVFRSKVVMGRHGFGRGEYKYFGYPLPELIQELRTALYPRLAPVANHWNELMRIDVRYPAAHAEFLERCHAAGETRPTPLLLPYEG